MNHEFKTKPDFAQIIAVIETYFDGLYEGDVDKLRQVFHPDTVLKANGIRLERDAWLAAVAERAVPQTENEPYKFNILFLDIVNDQALAKVEAPLFDKHFVDYLGLLKENDQWLIVNKTYTIV